MRTTLISAEWDKAVVATGPDSVVSAGAEWELVDLPRDQGRRIVAFRLPSGHFLSVQPGGRLEANRSGPGMPGLYETFIVEDQPDGTVAFRSWQGYLSMDDLGVVVANRAVADGWEKFRRPFERGLVGTLWIADGAFVDDTGPVLPVLCHAGDLLALYARDPEWAQAELDDIAAAGYHGVRVWTWLDGPYWKPDRHIAPTYRPDYWSCVRTFAEALRARGLRWLVSQGDMLAWAPDRLAFMRQLAETMRDAGGLEIVAGVDAGNESWQNGESDPQQLLGVVTAFRRVLDVPVWSLTSPQDEERAELDRYSGSVYDVHGSRGGCLADKIRHAFSIAYEQRPACRLGVQSEPPGPGPLVSVTDHQEELDSEGMPLLTAMHLLARQMSVYMSSPGVSCRARGEFARQPGFREAAAIRDMLPRDLMQYQTLTHGGTSQPRRIVSAIGDGDSLIRVDQAIHDDGRFVAVAYAATPGDWVVGLPIERACELTTIHPATRERLGPARYSPGDRLGLRFRRGRILAGRLL